jgi:hypothetical protein
MNNARSLLRLLLAGILFNVCIIAPIALLGFEVKSVAIPKVILIPGSILYSLLILAMAFSVANWGWWTRFVVSTDEYVRILERKKMLVSEEYAARRAFCVKATENEESNYFVELTDGRVVFLTGWFLHEYEPKLGGNEAPQPRRFPCTEFVILREKPHGRLIALVCHGSVLEPEIEAPNFGALLWEELGLEEDAMILERGTYDDIKRRCLMDTH